MKKLFLIICCLWFLFLGIRCKKNPQPAEVLPPITQTGANVFACKINGVVWIPHYPCDIYSPANELQYGIEPGDSTGILPLRFTLNAGKFAPPYSGFFNIYPFSSSQYIKDTGNIASTLYIVFFGDTVTSSKDPGDPTAIFRITKLDTVNKIVSGVFAFKMYSSFGPNSIKDSLIITDGRFDLTIGDYSRCSN
ncbi:MAG TPA: hypothetical protein VHZ50_15095 [Puia sp.]|nr:hypothetical protein [Puia sp.]